MKEFWADLSFDLTTLTYFYLSYIFDDLVWIFCAYLDLILAANIFNWFSEVWRNMIAKEEGNKKL